MTYIYRNDGPWGVGKGDNLDPDEMDGNLWQIQQDIEAKAAQGVGIANIVVTGNQLTVVLTDHTILGPYTLPTAKFNFRGEWLPSTSYFTNDIISAEGALYIVLQPHTSDTTFDPNDNDGAGNDFYGLILAAPTFPFNFRGEWQPDTIYLQNDIVTNSNSAYLVLRNHVSNPTFNPNDADGSGNKYYGLMLAVPAQAWDFGFSFSTTPAPNSVIQVVPVTRNILIPADFLHSVGACGTPPESNYVIGVTVNNVLIGTITIHSSGLFTFATVTGHDVEVVAGSIIRFVTEAIDSPALTIAAVACTIYATWIGGP